jgi:hypothetical protein
MIRSTSTRLRLGAAMASTAAALLFATAPPTFGGERGTSAEHRDGPGAVTEANDSDGVANDVVDAGDNRHPSGNDRSVEPGGSGDQGASASTPDQDGHGPERDVNGTDKPDGPGGLDVIDQDRNNGCGNDDDFEDDNEGWCGHQPAPETPGNPVTPPPPPTTPTVVVAGQVQPAAAAAAPVATQVLGLVLERPTPVSSAAPATSVAAAALARTGFAAVPLVALALALILVGDVLRRAARRGRPQGLVISS